MFTFVKLYGYNPSTGTVIISQINIEMHEQIYHGSYFYSLQLI